MAQRMTGTAPRTQCKRGISLKLEKREIASRNRRDGTRE